MAFTLNLSDEMDRHLEFAAAYHRVTKTAFIRAALTAAITADPKVAMILAADMASRLDAASERVDA